MTWLLAEDKAVKELFTGVTVTDANAGSGRPLEVRFGMPETELSAQTYPLAIINRSASPRATEREHRGWAPVTYWPEGNGAQDDSRNDPGTAPVVEYPIPMDLIYDVTVLCRLNNHMSQLALALAQPGRLPQRYGYLEVPEDGSVRSLFLDGGPEFSSTRDENNKRLFTISYNFRVPTELPPSIVSAAPVETINTVIVEE